ncbi:hypothetical protein FI667_g11001, partial [Globisporangium splendens]
MAVSINTLTTGTVFGFGALLSAVAEETRHERVHKLLRLLDATWEKIVAMQMKQKYLSLESAKRFVPLVELVEYELDSQQRFMAGHVLLPDGPSECEKTLRAEVASLKFMKFYRAGSAF